MLFHTWTFAAFLLIVLPVFFLLRKTRFWIVWLMLASYVFYGWWNPYYLALVLFSNSMDYFVVTLMERCPREKTPARLAQRLTIACRQDPVLKRFVAGALGAAFGVLALAFFGPATFRPALIALSLFALLMAAGVSASSRKFWVAISVVNNLSLVVFFKYAGFLVQNINGMLWQAHLNVALPEPAALMPDGFDYLLPAGISFFTFQSLSYTIDYYRGDVRREKSFLRFSTFVCFFPQLMAGPIERAKHLLPQFHKFPAIKLRNFTDGASLFLVGLFKKLALANYLSCYVDRVYEAPDAFDAPALLVATFAFAWQIYFDFSGYTDMARGIAKVMGFDLMLNFRNPYLAAGIGEFWTRWHISLSSWFRDYVYIPLGGNRGGKLLTYRNLLVTFIVSGIWHGASWTFLVWGLLHGAGVMLTRELERSPFYRRRVPKFAKQAGVFLFVCFAWIFFRAASLSDALLIVRRIFTAPWRDPQAPALMLLLVGLVWLYEALYESAWRRHLERAPVRVAAAVFMLLYVALFSSGGGTFIYFQF